MATDKTMPPNDPASMPSMPAGPSGTPTGMPSDAMPAGGGGDGVMISMPKAVFNELHNIVMQLAAGVDELAKRVAGSSPAMPQEPADQAAGEDMSAEGGSSDEDFLREMAAQGTK